MLRPSPSSMMAVAPCAARLAASLSSTMAPRYSMILTPPGMFSPADNPRPAMREALTSRGYLASTIELALGTVASAMSLARARLGLTPRGSRHGRGAPRRARLRPRPSALFARDFVPLVAQLLL